MATEKKWNTNVGFNKDTYKIRCTDESFGPSKSSGKPMITLQFEITEPEEMYINGDDYSIVGTRVTNYYITQALNEDGTIDEVKQKSNMERLEKLFKAFGLDFTGFNPENPTLGFKGKLVWALLYPDVTEQRRAPTREQAEKGQKQGDILKDPISGKTLTTTYPKIGDIYGLAEGSPNKPY